MTTPDISSSISDLVRQRNAEKILFTAGPASLLAENISGLRPCFGRGDDDYRAVETRVLDRLQEMTGHQSIVRLQGSATLALEIATLNFLEGKILVISSGYYSDRLAALTKNAQSTYKNISQIDISPWSELEQLSGNYDWVVACYTETSCALRIPIARLKSAATKLNARLMLDATASIGLEDDHDLADVIAYSSCKGLFGLTGAAFIAYNTRPSNEVNSFYLNLQTHIEKQVTGPYHAICSLDEVLKNHSNFKQAVFINKQRFSERMASYLAYPIELQPALCTYVSTAIKSNSPRAVLYTPRTSLPGSIVCHLGEAHLGSQAKAQILDFLEISL